MNLRPLLFTAAFLCASAPSAFAAQVFNTGNTAGGGLETQGNLDTHYPLFFPSTCCYSGLPTIVATAANLSFGSYSGASAWHANTATAQWTVYNGPTSAAFFEFPTTFTLTAGEVPGFQLSGMMAMSTEFVAIKLNNVSYTADAFANDFGAGLHAFTLTSGFATGENTLSFVQQWTDANQILFGNSRVGLLVDGLTAGSGGESVPEPSTYGLLMAGLGVIGYARVRRAGRTS